MRPEIEFRQDPEIDNRSEIQVSTSAICEVGSGTTRPDIPETVSEYVTADRLETSAAFSVSQEIVMETNPNFTSSPNPPPPHNLLKQLKHLFSCCIMCFNCFTV